MKRTIGLILLSIANFVILAHAVIPHNQEKHHIHSCNYICQHSASLNDIPPQDLSIETAHQNHHADHHDCILDNINIRFEDNRHTIQTENDITYTLLNLYLQYADVVVIDKDQSDLGFTKKQDIPLPCYIADFTQSKGLRAPPFYIL